MGSKNEVGKVEYHYGFYGAVHAEYEPTHVQMEYLQEHELGDEPVRMDMLILRETPRYYVIRSGASSVRIMCWSTSPRRIA